MNEKIRVFFDIDGTMATWRAVKTFEELLEPGFYASMDANINVVNAVKILKDKYGDDIELFSLSAYLLENQNAVPEKNVWMDAKAPEIDLAHRVFCPCGMDKRLAVPGGIRPTDVLVDDYTHNLNAWSESGKALKLLNGINGTKGTWKGPSISMFITPEEFASIIHAFAVGVG